MSDQADSASSPTQSRTFSFTYSLDADKYFRRECSQCGLHFKVSVSPEHIEDILTPFFKPETDKTAQPSDTTQSTETLTCPYCGHIDSPQNMLTDELVGYIRRVTRREILALKIDQMLSNFAESFGSRSYGSRGFGISMSVDYHRSPREPRPLSGPEPNDMIRVQLLCCDRSIKIADNWQEPIFCPYCQRQLVLR